MERHRLGGNGLLAYHDFELTCFVASVGGAVWYAMLLTALLRP